MSATPLSDAITRLNQLDTKENYVVVLEELLRSNVGLIASNLPAGATSPGVVSDGSIKCASVQHPDGRELLLVCADRAVFVTRFARPFNAEVDLTNLTAIVLANPALGGVLINSAASEHSAVVARDTLERLGRRIPDRHRPPVPQTLVVTLAAVEELRPRRFRWTRSTRTARGSGAR